MTQKLAQVTHLQDTSNNSNIQQAMDLFLLDLDGILHGSHVVLDHLQSMDV